MNPIPIGDRRELFVDHSLIDHFDGAASLKMHPPQRQDVVFQVRAPLENACSGVYSVLLEESKDRYLLYYRGNYPLHQPGGDAAHQQTANVAISPDGLNFTRPELGIHDLGDGGKNNIVWQGVQAHNFVPFIDRNPKASTDERFKAVGGTGRDKLFALCSPDGLHWRMMQETPLKVSGAFDSANVPFWDAVIGKYRLFSRDFQKCEDGNYRIIQSCESDDFIHWTQPIYHKYDPSVPLEQFYTNATTPCPGAEHILLSFPMRYVHTRSTPVADTSDMDYPGNPGSNCITDSVMMSSRDGVHWHRPFQEAWLRPGLDERNWTHRNNCPAIGILPLHENAWSMYVSEHYGWPDNRLRRMTVRPWGFASIHADRVGGQVITQPLTFRGSQLRINFATSAVGDVTVELQDQQGAPIPGFSLEDATPIYGDRLDHTVEWAKGADLSHLAGKPVRLRYQLNDADVYAMRFAR